MRMKNPPHPGLSVRYDCLEPLGLSVAEGAKVLDVTRQALNNLVKGRAGISAEMAIRLHKAFGGGAETWLRMSRESRGRALFTVRFFNPNLKAVADLISGDHVLPGLGDAGAHVGQIMDSGWCSFVLSHWVRETGLFSAGEAVRRMTSAPARLIGLRDRGTLEPGLRADVNVIDLERVHEKMPEYVHDFPGGAGRFVQRAEGYRATLCNGELTLENDEHTGTRPGRVVRH